MLFNDRIIEAVRQCRSEQLTEGIGLGLVSPIAG
jgi:hypothetical protein